MFGCEACTMNSKLTTEQFLLFLYLPSLFLLHIFIHSSTQESFGGFRLQEEYFAPGLSSSVITKFDVVISF